MCYDCRGQKKSKEITPSDSLGQLFLFSFFCQFCLSFSDSLLISCVGMVGEGAVECWGSGLVESCWKTSRLQGTPVGTFGKVLWK